MRQCDGTVRRNGQQRRCVRPEGHWGWHQADSMAAASTKYAARLRAYRVTRRTFLAARQRCEFPAGCTMPATEVHHRKGRIGPLLLDETHWSALCHDHHAWVTEHPAESVAMGISELRVGVS